MTHNDKDSGVPHKHHHLSGTLDHDFGFKAFNDEDHDAAEEVAEKILWKKWNKGPEPPDTFGFLELAKDGGFAEVPALYSNGTTMRWLNAGVMVVFVLYNVVSVIQLDLHWMFEPRAAAEALSTTLPAIQKFYLSKAIIANVAGLFGRDTSAFHSTFFLGLFELMGLLFLLGRLVYDSATLRRKGGFTRWFKCQKIFWETVPTLSVYSGMRLLYCIIPSVITNDVCDLVELVDSARKEPRLMPAAITEIFQWLISTILKFVVGFDTFLMKLRIVTAVASSQDLSVWVFLPTLQFFIQVIGIVQLGPFTRKRLFTFIFGGEDGVMQEDELVNMNTWNALLAKRIFESNSPMQFLVVMLSFSDLDFQSLVLNENREKKDQMQTGGVSMSHSLSLFARKDAEEMKSDIEGKVIGTNASKCCCFKWGQAAKKKTMPGIRESLIESPSPGRGACQSTVEDGRKDDDCKGPKDRQCDCVAM